ncbi:MAG: phage tail tube protein [Enterocloster bolteae]
MNRWRCQTDLENFAPSIDGTAEEWYSMDAAGWAKAAMTGKKLQVQLQGKRSVGDPGNDYIAGLAVEVWAGR